MVLWKAIYSDNTELFSHNEDGSSNKYTNINRAKLIKFIFYKADKPVIILNLDSNKRLIFRRRVVKPFNKPEESVYLIGWQETRNNTNFQSISFLFEDGHIEILDGFKKDHEWFYPINFLPQEQI